MTSETIRDPVKDQLLTPQNSTLIIIDYQPVQVTSVASMDRQKLVSNIVAVARTAKLYGLPIVLSTVNVKTGKNPQPSPHFSAGFATFALRRWSTIGCRNPA